MTKPKEEMDIDASQTEINCKRKACEILYFGLLLVNEHRAQDYIISYKQMVDKLDQQTIDCLENIDIIHDKLKQASILKRSQEVVTDNLVDIGSIKAKITAEMDSVLG